jgi:hypothetical protein
MRVASTCSFDQHAPPVNRVGQATHKVKLREAIQAAGGPWLGNIKSRS